VNDEPKAAYLAGIIPVGPTCAGYGHRLEPLEDLLVCVDCSQFAARAVRDELDVDEVLMALRAWEPQP
jgi:hypothetical protein